MTSFTAINIIPDSDSDSEIDNTLELQIEEALKIYQKAIKAHSECNLQEAESAYNELFKSEIFEHAEIVAGPDEGRNTSASSSIHSILYLAYKNHAAFLLDRLKAQNVTDLNNLESRKSLECGISWFAEALARDPGDASLWRSTAQLSKAFNFTRLTRFCLESVLQGGDESEDFIDIMNEIRSFLRPDEFLASLQLRDVLIDLGDETTFSQTFFKWLKRKKAKKLLQRHLEPYPWLKGSLPNRKYTEIIETANFNASSGADLHILHVQSRTWAAVGKALLRRRQTVDEKNAFHLSNYICLDLPPPSIDSPSSTCTATPQETTPDLGEAVTTDDGDIRMTEAMQTVAEMQKDSSNRKRKSTSLGGADELGRSRLSKRVRDRENANAAAAAAAPPPAPVRQLVFQDEKLFETVEMCFSPLGISLGQPSALKAGIRGDDETISPRDQYLPDFKSILRNWDDDKGNVILYGEGIQDPKEEATPGTALLSIESSSSLNIHHPVLSGGEGLKKWLKVLDKDGTHVKEFCLNWLKALLMRDWVDSVSNETKVQNDILAGQGKSSWLRHSWPETLRDVVVAMVNDCEELLWNHFKEWEVDYKCRLNSVGVETFGEKDLATVEWAQSIFEIFLGDLARGDKERAALDTEELQEKWEQLRDTCRRWSYLVGDLIHCRPRDEVGELPEDQLTFRYLWANAVFTGLNANASRYFVLDCFEDIKKTLANSQCPPIELPNSTVMPEISVVRAERELSKLKTMDFFTNIFRATTHVSDPVEVIVSLEAVLNPQSLSDLDMGGTEVPHLEEMAKFLEGSSTQFKLYLWERLREAYERLKENYEHGQVGFMPKIMACRLKCIDLIVSEFNGPSYLDHSDDHRQFILLRAIRLLEANIPPTLKLAFDDQDCLSLDINTLINSLESLFSLLRLLHTYSFYEDGVMNSEYAASNLHSYRLVVVKFRGLLVKTWCLVYLIYRAVIDLTHRGEFDLPDDPKMLLGSLLRDIHEDLGVRNYCKLSNHDFLRLMQAEYLRFDAREFDEELSQCLHCRYHLNVGADEWDLYEHKTDQEFLDKKSALAILDFVLFIASKKKIQQLPRAEIKDSLDELIKVIGIPKKKPKIQYNEGVLEQYLNGSINPLNLFRSLKGVGEISMAPITDQASAKGLYFLMGHIHLSLIRDRSIKNRVQVKSDDLDNALKYFRYTLICDPENWEAWFRLAQTYGQQVDEDMSWSAEPMNNQREDLIKKERRCIMSFIMALATSVHFADDSEETQKNLTAMYYEFAYRIYASSRAPMNMETWKMDGFVKHFSGTQGQGMYKKLAHKEVTLRIALRFAVHLLEKALERSPENWKYHYIMGKCMGKLEKERKVGGGEDRQCYTPDQVLESDREVNCGKNQQCYTPEEVLEQYARSIKYAPEKTGSELLPEPHHKLVSAACKYVLNDKIQPAVAYKFVVVSPYAKGTTEPTDRASFLSLTLSVLAKMKAADKQRWHHRMTHRIASLLYNGLNSSDKERQHADIVAAAKELSSLFTVKASTLAIWRPENERPGRHFVYAHKYTIFYVSLLEQLGDRATLEIVAKRVRKNSGGLWGYPQVWENTLRAYISVLRSTGNVERGLEDEITDKVGWNEFQTFSAQLELYCNPQPSASGAAASTPPQHPLLDLFKEVAELRRLNMGSRKAPEVDELLVDTYAKLYLDLLPEIINTEPASAPSPETPSSSAGSNPMSLSNLMLSDTGAIVHANNGSTSGTATGGTVTPTNPASAAVQLAATHAKRDFELPWRGAKLTKVSRKELMNKAGNLFRPAIGAAGKGAVQQQQQAAHNDKQSQLAGAALNTASASAGSNGTGRRGSGPSVAGAKNDSLMGDTVVVGGGPHVVQGEDSVMASPGPLGEDGGEEGDDEGEDGDDEGDNDGTEVL